MLADFRPQREPEDVVEDVLARAREIEDPELVWWVKLGAPSGMDELVRARGGVLDETLDVLALRPGSRTCRISANTRSTLRWTTEETTLRHAYERAQGRVRWGRPTRPAVEGGERRRSGTTSSRGAEAGSSPTLDDEPVGTGGLTVADDVGRLWSGAVLEEHRGRGVYRAMLAARLAYAMRHGAAMVLVKGRVETSGPILRRAGFDAFGQERSYRVRL